MNRNLDVAIIGGGIAGLAVLDRLRAIAPGLSVRLFEASDRAGGKVRSDLIEHDAGRFIIEAGPDGWLARKPWATELAIDLGLANQLTPISATTPGVSILAAGDPVPIPPGVHLIASTNPETLADTGLLSAVGANRMEQETAIPPAESDADESLAAFVRRRLGDEAVSALAEPLAAGIHNADPERISMAACFPQFRDLERSHGSVLTGLRANQQSDLTRTGVPVFQTLRNGVGSLIEPLAARNIAAIQTSASLDAITRTGLYRYYLAFANGETINANALVLATPAADSARLIARLAPEAAWTLNRFRTAPAGAITFAVPTESIAKPFAGYGLIVPAREQRPINAITFASRKWQHRAPDGWDLIRVFFGGHRSPATMTLPDDDLRAMVLDQLRSLIGLNASPAFDRIVRWPTGSPQYDVGHLDRLAMIAANQPPGLHLIGSAFHGTGLPDLIRHGQETAATIAESFAHIKSREVSRR